MHLPIWKSGRQVLLPLLAFTLLSNPLVRAQSGQDGTNQTELIQQLLKRINDLEASQKIMQDKLEQMGAASTPVTPAATQGQEPASAQIAETQQETTPEATPTITLGPIQFHGFSDIDYGRAWFEDLPAGGLKGFPSSFSLGDFDLFTNTELSDHWSMLGEMLATTDFTNETSVEMDRLLLSYKTNDYFKISFGKFDTSLGYYTTDIHRAQYFQTTIGRPIMYSDEDSGGVLPVHNIGVTATGLVPSGKLGLHWAADVANGRSSTSPDVPIQNFADEGNGKAVNGEVYVRPEWLEGFQAGVSIYHDTLHPVDIPTVGQIILTGHVVYVTSKLEWLNEAAMLRHSVVGGRTFHDVTSYSQVSYAFGKTRPFFRYDYQNIAAGDPIFGTLGRRNGPSVGVNRHLSNYVILKVQYGRLTQGNVDSINDFLAQLAFAF